MNVHQMTDDSPVTHDCSGGGGHPIHDCANGDGLGEYTAGACSTHDDCEGASLALRVLDAPEVSSTFAATLARRLPQFVEFDAETGWLSVKNCDGGLVAIRRAASQAASRTGEPAD